MAIVFQKPKSLTDATLHYCPGCTHGIVHRLVAEQLAGRQADAHGPGRVAAGRADHDRPENIKQTHGAPPWM